MKYLPIILLLLATGCRPTIHTEVIEAEVLAINENVLHGKMIGQFLGSSSGWFNDIGVVVAVRWEFKGRLHLSDYKIKIAELIHYKDRGTLPLTVRWADYGSSWGIRSVKLGHRHLKQVKVR